jgi:hypothetical protein
LVQGRAGCSLHGIACSFGCVHRRGPLPACSLCMC